nr:unnamed protein product [Digitaria exilis]
MAMASSPIAVAAFRHQAPSAFPAPIPARFSPRHRRRPRRPLSSVPAAADGDASSSAVSAVSQRGAPTSPVLTFQQAIQRLQVQCKSLINASSRFITNHTCSSSSRPHTTGVLGLRRMRCHAV